MKATKMYLTKVVFGHKRGHLEMQLAFIIFAEKPIYNVDSWELNQGIRGENVCFTRVDNITE